MLILKYLQDNELGECPFIDDTITGKRYCIDVTIDKAKATTDIIFMECFANQPLFGGFDHGNYGMNLFNSDKPIITYKYPYSLEWDKDIFEKCVISPDASKDEVKEARARLIKIIMKFVAREFNNNVFLFDNCIEEYKKAIITELEETQKNDIGFHPNGAENDTIDKPEEDHSEETVPEDGNQEEGYNLCRKDVDYDEWVKSVSCILKALGSTTFRKDPMFVDESKNECCIADIINAIMTIYDSKKPELSDDYLEEFNRFLMDNKIPYKVTHSSRCGIDAYKIKHINDLFYTYSGKY